mgnify:CR=1 FL=1
MDTPIKEEVKPQPTPPSNGGGSIGGGGGSVTPPTVDDKEEVKPEIPNGIEGLGDLDKVLQEKVDSIIAESVVESQGLILNITGDNDDMGNISYVKVKKDGIFAVVILVAVLFSSDAALEGVTTSVEPSASDLKFTDGAVMAAGLLIAIAFVAIIVGSLKNMFSK